MARDDTRGHALPLALFDYALPIEAVAQRPCSPPDHSKLMVLGACGALEHRRFYELPQLLEAGDLLVLNHTKVIPARLIALRPSGAPVELLIHTPMGATLAEAMSWQAIGRPGKALRPQVELTTRAGSKLRILDRQGPTITVMGEEPLLAILQREGRVPLPPYLERAAAPSDEDLARYQSIFAAEPGAVAAPTASLHFTPETMVALKKRGVRTTSLVLHVGPGTFLPVRPEQSQDVRDHVMHHERYMIPQQSVTALVEARAAGRRIVAVGTTVLRALETWAANGCSEGTTNLFVFPGYKPKLVAGLITNFHLPKSTLIMLVAALTGTQRLLDAYRLAMASGYRFFSYGDAMLVWPSAEQVEPFEP